MTKEKTNNKSWLNYVNLSDLYERKARFLPGILSLLFLLPASSVYNNFIDSWIKVLLVGAGIGCVLAVGISHLASAAGNSFQEKLWPDWPYDSPTNLWLHPDDNSRSRQQKEIWYASITRVTGLDIKAALKSEDEDIKLIINDSISAIRYRLRNSTKADLLQVHNADYGFARNFTGLRFLWLPFAVISCFSCWINYFGPNGNVLPSIIATGFVIFSCFLAFKILPKYVRLKAKHYAESFFGALSEMDRGEMLPKHKS